MVFSEETGALVFKIRILQTGRVNIVMKNKDDREKHVFFAVECLHCGKINAEIEMMQKADVKEKLASLGNIDHMMGVGMVIMQTMMLNMANTKSHITVSTNSRLE